ncbi:preprotein translocase subunit SecG [Maricaulis sp. D1M11]|uniref:preprotein translocase subunit SecG n=1 Tax=Maricaulis sp. D1M11 TaxID=3076117 RepID=UPI0039B44BEF
MLTVVLVIQGIVALALTGSVLMQRSEGGALGIGGGGGGGGGLMSSRGAATAMSRLTMILGATFVGLCILLAVMTGVTPTDTSVVTDEQDAPSLLEQLESDTPASTDG